MNVHEVLRRSLISKYTQVNGRKLQKPLFFQSILPPNRNFVGGFFFFLYSLLISKDLPLYPTIF